MAGLSDLIQLIDTNIFDNVGGGVDAGPVRDVFIALATAGISNQNTLDELLELIAVKIPDRIPGSTELIDPNELRDVFVALATAITSNGGSSIFFAARKTICFRINDSNGNPPPTAPVANGIDIIPVLNPVSINDLVALVPEQTRESCDVYRTQQWQAPYAYDSTTLLEGEDVFITFFNYQDMGALYDLVQQILANQNAQIL